MASAAVTARETVRSLLGQRSHLRPATDTVRQNIHRSLSPLDQHELHISESSTELELRRGDWDPMLTQEQNRGLKRWGTQHRMFYRHRKPSSKRTPQTEHTANVLE